MDISSVLDYVIKWAVPFICAGLFASTIKPLFNTFLIGHHRNAQAEWDKHASKVIARIDEMDATNKKADSKLAKQIEAVAEQQN